MVAVSSELCGDFLCIERIDGLGPGRAWGGSSFVLDVDLSFMLIRVSSIIIASALVCRFSTVNFCRDGREDKTKTAHAVYVWCEF